MSAEIKTLLEKVRGHRHAEEELRGLNATYGRLLRYSRDQCERVVKEVQGQFDKEKEKRERERERERKEKEEQEAKEKAASGEKTEDESGEKETETEKVRNVLDSCNHDNISILPFVAAPLIYRNLLKFFFHFCR